MSIWLAAGVLLSLTLAEGQTISGPNTIGIGQDLTLFCNFVPGVGQTIHIYQWSFTGAVTGLTLFDDCTVFNEGDLAVLSYTKQCNGNDFTLTLQAVTQYTLSKRWCCNVGLVAGGAGTESCKTVGIDADCGNPTEPTNGQVTFTTTTYQSTATYSCDSGYTIDGTATTTCQADGTWSGSVPTCTAVPTLTIQPAAPITGSTLTLTCQMAGFTKAVMNFNKDGTTVYKCFSGGQPCADIGGISDYSEVDWSQTNKGIVTLANADQSRDGGDWTCAMGGGGGTSVAVTLTLADADCGNPTKPTNGQISFTTTTYQSTATYSCDSGYTLDETVTTTCQVDGIWSGSVPPCTADVTPPSGVNGPLIIVICVAGVVVLIIIISVCCCIHIRRKSNVVYEQQIHNSREDTNEMEQNIKPTVEVQGAAVISGQQLV